MAERVRPPERRPGLTYEVAFAPPGHKDTKLIVTFGFWPDDEGRPRIIEAFCASFRADSQVCSMANDAMIMLSHLLQRGESIEMLAAAMGEDTTAGKPLSIVGAILRKAVEVDRELRTVGKVVQLRGTSAIATVPLPEQDDAMSAARELTIERMAEARAKGYEGECCTDCGNFTLVRNGTCLKCETCGATTGCS